MVGPGLGAGRLQLPTAAVDLVDASKLDTAARHSHEAQPGKPLGVGRLTERRAARLRGGPPVRNREAAVARLTAVAWVLGMASLAAGRDARADAPNQGWDGRVFLGVNGGYRPASGSFGYRDTQTVFQEEASAQASFARRGAPAFEIGGGVRLWGHLGIGATLSAIHENQPTTLSVTVPHPVFFNRPATGSAADSSSHNELALHLQAVFMAPMGRKLRLGVFGGPSRFWLHQQMVNDADLQPTLLPDLSFTLSVPTLRGEIANVSAWGFHAGADLTMRLSKNVGIGGVVRYSHATAYVENALAAARTGDGGKTVPIRLGGLQATGGLRFWF
jgi:hypothetical protein